MTSGGFIILRMELAPVRTSGDMALEALYLDRGSPTVNSKHFPRYELSHSFIPKELRPNLIRVLLHDILCASFFIS